MCVTSWKYYQGGWDGNVSFSSFSADWDVDALAGAATVILDC